MKRFLLMLVMVFTVTYVSAQIYSYRTTEFAFKTMNSYGSWNNWTDWESSDVLITINFNTDVVTIYSPKTQVYKITEFTRKFTDNSGGNQVEFRFIDQDYDRGTMRLRIERNGNSQLYVEFANVIWVYNVRRTN